MISIDLKISFIKFLFYYIVMNIITSFSVRIIKASGTEPWTAFANRAVSFNFIEKFLVVDRVAALDALHTVSSQAFPLQMTKRVATAELFDNLKIGWFRHRLAIKRFDSAVVHDWIRCSCERIRICVRLRIEYAFFKQKVFDKRMFYDSITFI